MTKITILLAFALMAASAEAILNGELSPHKPYFARISYRPTSGSPNQVNNMAGTILSDRFVLTTGIFFFDANEIRVWVGSYVRALQQSYSAVQSLRLSTHPDGPALIQLEVPLNFSRAVHSIRMFPLDVTMGLQNEQGLVVGMGGLAAGNTRDRLNSAFMRIVPNHSCASSYPGRDLNAYFCAYDARSQSNFCPEDRGSALTILHRGEEFLVGIAVESACGTTGNTRPSLFASIRHFRNRINEILDGRERPSN